MYYEEKIINGVLCWRSKPDDEWTPYTIAELSWRHVEQGTRLNKEMASLRAQDGLPGCGICGGKQVLVRGRYPNTLGREACPTCLTERLDQIRGISSSHYGQAAQAK